MHSPEINKMSTRYSYRLVVRSIVGVLFLVLTCGAYAQTSSNDTVTLGFDGLSDLSVEVDDLGVAFTGATVLACGGSLNCSQFPPYSGQNVIYDTIGLGGTITATFDPTITGNVRKVSARVTGNTNITITVFDKNGTALGSSSTGGANYVDSGSGIPPNKLLEVTLQEFDLPIQSVMFQDGGNSFTVDDFTFTKGKRIMLDAGHGQIQVGSELKYQREATETFGLYEDVLTLDMANSTAMVLEENYVVFMTRTGARAPFAPANCGVPCNIDLDKRRELAEKYEVDVLVSIHTNADSNKTSNGTKAFYKGSGNNSSDLAARVVNAVSALGTKNSGSQQFSYRVLSSKMSNTLIEVAFHTNSQLAPGQTVTDEARLNSATYRSQAGKAIAGAVDAFIDAQSQP